MRVERPGYLRDSEPFPETWRPIFRELVERLVRRDYAGLLADGFLDPAHSENPSNFGTWIEDYPDELAEFPDDPWPRSSCIPSEKPGVYHADIKLWTETQHPSDLTLTAIVRDDDSGSPEVVLYDAHVM